MKHKSEILQKHREGYSIKTIQRIYSYTADEIAEVIAKAQIEIQSEQFYIVPSKMNYL